MSVFGGDSWAREAQQRKRKVDDLMLSSDNYSSASFKKLSNGKYACLVCPHNPVLDSRLSLSLHNKGSRHIAAVSKVKERELSRQEELNKRIALSSDATAVPNSSTSSQRPKNPTVNDKPLIEQSRQAILDVLSNRSCYQNAKKVSCATQSATPNHMLEPSKSMGFAEPPNISENINEGITEAAGKMLADWNDELRNRREKELKFTAAGWKRDGYGKWYKDENVDFDSDEEDPNEYFK